MTKSWAKAMSERTMRDLEHLEYIIKNHLNRISEGSFSWLVKTDFIELETKRNKLLIDQEEHWRIKSRAIWIKSGDLNTKKIHQFAKGGSINTYGKLR